MAEYEATGVTMVKEPPIIIKDRWSISFLDSWKEGSFYTLHTNPAGTVNIKITRDGNNNITGAAYMTEAEVIELLGDMDDSDDKTVVEIIPVDFKTG